MVVYSCAPVFLCSCILVFQYVQSSSPCRCPVRHDRTAEVNLSIYKTCNFARSFCARKWGKRKKLRRKQMEGRLRSYVRDSLSLSLPLCVCAAHNRVRRAVPFPIGTVGTHSLSTRAVCSRGFLFRAAARPIYNTSFLERRSLLKRRILCAHADALTALWALHVWPSISKPHTTAFLEIQSGKL